MTSILKWLLSCSRLAWALVCVRAHGPGHTHVCARASVSNSSGTSKRCLHGEAAPTYPAPGGCLCHPAGSPACSSMTQIRPALTPTSPGLRLLQAQGWGPLSRHTLSFKIGSRFQQCVLRPGGTRGGASGRLPGLDHGSFTRKLMIPRLRELELRCGPQSLQELAVLCVLPITHTHARTRTCSCPSCFTT